MLMRENKGFFSFAFDSAHVRLKIVDPICYLSFFQKLPTVQIEGYSFQGINLDIYNNASIH